MLDVSPVSVPVCEHDYREATDSHVCRVCLCSEFYEPNALMMEEEGAVIAGLLVGLNVIDANLCMKGEDLDSQVL